MGSVESKVLPGRRKEKQEWGQLWEGGNFQEVEKEMIANNVLGPKIAPPVKALPAALFQSLATDKVHSVFRD